MCPTSAMAKFTMRRDRPPAFMISPASMKKGTASSGKLLAPSITFCARICASNMFICHISAAPHSSRAKAIGTPSAMAANNEPRKIAIVISVAPGSVAGRGMATRVTAMRCFFGLLDQHQVCVIHLAAEQTPQVRQHNGRAQYGKHHPRGIENAHGHFHHRAGGLLVDEVLVVRTFGHQPQAKQHEHEGQRHAYLLASGAQAA